MAYGYQVKLTLGARAQRGPRVTVAVLCVCLFVSCYYSRTTGYEAAYDRYQQFQCYKGMKTNVAILLKPLRTVDISRYGVKIIEKANIHN